MAISAENREKAYIPPEIPPCFSRGDHPEDFTHGLPPRGERFWRFLQKSEKTGFKRRGNRTLRSKSPKSTSQRIGISTSGGSLVTRISLRWRSIFGYCPNLNLASLDLPLRRQEGFRTLQDSFQSWITTCELRSGSDGKLAPSRQELAKIAICSLVLTKTVLRLFRGFREVSQDSYGK